MRRLFPLGPGLPVALAAAVLAGCTQEPGTPPAFGLVAFRLPAINLTVGSDPVATAAASVASHLADPPSRLAGRPAVAAQVAAQYEFLTEALREPRFIGLDPLAQPQLARARPQLRDAIGIGRDAPPGQVTDSLTALAGALNRGDLVAAERVLSDAPFVRPPGQVLATLQAMPPVPAAARAASFADAQLNRAAQMSPD